MIKLDNGIWIPNNGQDSYDWTMAEIGIPKLLMDTVESLGRSVNNVIHAGGNIGLYTLEYSKRSKNVYVFEPENENFSALSLNCSHKENVFLYKAALGNNNNPISLKNEDEHCGTWSVDGSGNIPTFKIDDLNLSDVSIIHLDVEGFELFAIQGAKETIRKNKPLLAFEIMSHSKKYNYTQEELFNYVISLGYTSYNYYCKEVVFI